ncbi:MAG: hypothetical protein R3F18_02020 [Lysobacterales bacterium]|nr:hypothetical protein [Xanthomonadales bacterium]
MKQTLRDLAILAALAFTHSAIAGLPGTMSGTWYNPAQSGHGLSLDVLAADRAVAIWHVFDADGQPVTLYIDGQLDGRHLSGPVYAPKGMRFGSFDPAQLQLPVWGQVNIEFASCNEALLSWTSTQPGFVAGEMPLVRLTQTDGQSCTLPPQNPLPAGLYHGEIQANAITGSASSDIEGIVDGEGRLWGFERRNRNDPSSLQIPGPTWIGAYPPRVFRIDPTTVSGNEITARSAIYSAHALWLPTNLEVLSVDGNWQTVSAATIRGDFGPASPSLGAFSWRAGAAPGNQLVAPVVLAQIQGRHDFTLRGQFFDFPAALLIGADGSLCIQAGYDGTPDSCRLRGRISAPEGQLGLLEFSVNDESRPALAGFSGRGWLIDSSRGRELLLVGDNGTVGLLVVTRPR